MSLLEANWKSTTKDGGGVEAGFSCTELKRAHTSRKTSRDRWERCYTASSTGANIIGCFITGGPTWKGRLKIGTYDIYHIESHSKEAGMGAGRSLRP